MSRLKTAFFALFCLCSLLKAQQINTPLLITGKVFNSRGQQIATNALHFRVFPEGMPLLYLDQNAVSCGYNPPFWFAELGNLQTNWNYGDPWIIILEDIVNHETARFTWIIDSTGRVPDIQTQPVTEKELISRFRLSDRGVFHNEPLNFIFQSVFNELPAVELKIFSPRGEEIYKSSTPRLIDPGQFGFTWDGKSITGKSLPSGMYYYFFYVEKNVLHSGVITLKNE